jgi:hypothetical protein
VNRAPTPSATRKTSTRSTDINSVCAVTGSREGEGGEGADVVEVVDGGSVVVVEGGSVVVVVSCKNATRTGPSDDHVDMRTAAYR